MPRGQAFATKLAITVDPDVHAQIIAAAAAEGLSVSAWMTAAAPGVPSSCGNGLAAVAEWEAEHGTFTRRGTRGRPPKGSGAGQPERRSA